jgi:DNA-directed RNA polymerase subunit RPC12/RpoP
MGNRPERRAVRDAQNFAAVFNDRRANFCDAGRMALMPSGKKSVYQRGVVACRKCAAPIHFFRLQMLAEEFSLRCPHCGERSLYAKREIGIEELPERRRKPRRER